MHRHILTATAALLLMSPAFAQPDPDDGLPGRPVLPSDQNDDDEADADANEEETEENKEAPSLGEVGLSVASYLGGLIVEDPKITVGGWYAVGNYPGVEFRFQTRRLDVGVNQGIGGDAPHRRTIKFDDLIGERVILQVRQNAERFRGDGFAQTDVTGGYRFRDAPLLPLDATFEVKLFHDDPSQTGYDRYRAMVSTMTPGSGGSEDAGLYFKHGFRIGLERASIAGNGATRVVAGQGVEFGIGHPEVTDGFFKFHVDVETAFGGFDAGNGPSTGLNTRLGMGFGEYDRWRVGLNAERLEEKRAGIFARSSEHLRIQRYSIDGAVALGGGFEVDGKFELFRVRNQIDGVNLRTQDTRFRGSLGVGYKWLRAGTELGQDLDGKWRPRVTAGVTIPFGR